MVKKQAPTPIKSAPPKDAQPLKIENTKEPKANIVVSDVRKIAFPVLEKIIRIFPQFAGWENSNQKLISGLIAVAV